MLHLHKQLSTLKFGIFLRNSGRAERTSETNPFERLHSKIAVTETFQDFIPCEIMKGVSNLASGELK